MSKHGLNWVKKIVHGMAANWLSDQEKFPSAVVSKKNVILTVFWDKKKLLLIS